MPWEYLSAPRHRFSLQNIRYRTLKAWLTQIIQRAGDALAFDTLMKQMRHVDSGGHFSRDDMHAGEVSEDREVPGTAGLETDTTIFGER